MTRITLFVLVGLLGAALVPLASAQTAEYCIGRIPVLPDEFEGRDPSGLSLSDALDALLRRELDINGVSTVLGRAILHAESRHADQLKAIAESYRCEGLVSFRAFVALVYLDEPASYFTGTLERWIDEGFPHVGELLNTLAVRPRASVLPEYGRLRQRALGTPAEREVWYGLSDGLPRYEAKVRRDERSRLLPVAEQADDFARRALVFYIAGGLYNAETGRFSLNELAAFDDFHAHAVDRFREIARVYPTVAQEAADRWLAAMALGQDRDARPNIVVIRPSAATDDERYSQEPTAAELSAVSAFVQSEIPDLLPALAEVPPVELGADLHPGPVCVEDGPGGGLVARFRYELAGPDSVRVPFGSSNALSSQQGQQPEAFYPGPDGWGQNWTVALGGDNPVTWTLLGQSVTATASSPRCGQIAGPVATCNGRPATIYVSNGRVVGGPLDGTLYAGRLVGTDGPDVLVGTDNPDAIDGGAGDDTICGLAGNDALRGDDGTDTADGGDGTDGCDSSETSTACEGAVPAIPDVRPVLECVAPATGGGFVAYFGYENRGTRAGRVAYGSNNRITPAALNRAQPDLFGLPSVVAGRPGRTPFYPGHGFTVAFPRGETVVWKLFNRTSSASASSPRCSAP